MNTTLDQKIAGLPLVRRNKILRESERLQEEYLTLKELRKARQMTQVRLAESLRISQASIANLEKRSDLLLSTLRGYVHALGGEFDIVVRFPGKPPLHLASLGEADGTNEQQGEPQLPR